MDKWSTRSVWPYNSATLVMDGYFQMEISLLANPWEDTSSLYSLDQSNAHTWVIKKRYLNHRSEIHREPETTHLRFRVRRVETGAIIAIPDSNRSIRSSTSRGQNVGLPRTPSQSFHGRLMLSVKCQSRINGSHSPKKAQIVSSWLDNYDERTKIIIVLQFFCVATWVNVIGKTNVHFRRTLKKLSFGKNKQPRLRLNKSSGYKRWFKDRLTKKNIWATSLWSIRLVPQTKRSVNCRFHH